jgi:hypothetical protein
MGLALTMVSSAIIVFFAFFGIIVTMGNGNLLGLIFAVICLVVFARLATITYRPTRARWKR